MVEGKSPLEEGSYKYNDSHNFDEYLKELGVPWYMRAMAKIATPTVTIKKLNDHIESSPTTVDMNDSWEIKTDTIFRSHIVRFTMNEALVDQTLDGRKVNMTVTRQSENRWIEKQKNLDNGKETMIVRDFFTDRMMVNLTAGAVRSFSTFIRQFTKN